GCHNPEGAASLAAFLDQAGLSGRCPLVFGAMADKPVEEIAQILFPRVSRVLLVTAPSARAATAPVLLRRVGSLHPRVAAVGDLEAALEDRPSDRDAGPRIVAGSLYLIGQARRVTQEAGSGKGHR